MNCHDIMTFNAQIKRGYLPIRSGQVHYRCAGERRAREPPLVLLHQTASSSVMYEALMARLAQRFFIFAPDTPGFGGSDALPGQVTISRYAGVLADCLRRFEIGECLLFGHHSGASIAAQIAHDHPERVQRLVLSGPPLLSRAQLEALVPAVEPLALAPDGGHLAAVWRRIRAKDAAAPVELSQRETILTLVAGARYSEAYEAVFHHDLATVLGRITQPTLVMAGPADPLFASLEPAHRLLLRGSCVVLERGGTYVCDREPDLVARALLHFLESEAPR
jgi:pimeloyl-ACP methyl ester carboxylesterase